MTFPCKVDWKWPGSQVREQSLNATVGDVDELRQRLANIRAEAETRKVAISVVVVTPNTNIFSVVVGLSDGSIVTYDGRGGDPPYFVSLGDVKKDLNLVSYFYMGERSELPASHVIPQDLALEALVDSVENEQPSSLIRWYGG